MEFEQKLSHICEQHTAKLTDIDSKMRKTLRARDCTINDLLLKVSDADKRCEAVERMLSDLNS
jgi:predicted RNase H-like nuclease (RuvC/YqgF family)